MNFSYYILFFVSLALLELIYFRLARRFNILDHPNSRSLHGNPTIRGGGIIFFLSAALFFGITFRPDSLFFLTLTMVSVVGFVDDVKSLSSTIRFIIQSLAFGLVIMDLYFNETGILTVLIIFIVSVGALNTFNFMDGINGMTGGYGLISLASLLYINSFVVHFMDTDFIVAIIMSLVVFCFFNFRTKAVCFAGDVGSLAIGFIIIYLIIKLINVSCNYAYVFLLSVYGVDSVMTIIHRLVRRENIFKAHKLHLFQVTVNHFRIPHVRMSALYAVIQLIVNIGLILSLNFSLLVQFAIGLSLILMLAMIYLFVKFGLLKHVQFT